VGVLFLFPTRCVGPGVWGDPNVYSSVACREDPPVQVSGQLGRGKKLLPFSPLSCFGCRPAAFFVNTPFSPIRHPPIIGLILTVASILKPVRGRIFVHLGWISSSPVSCSCFLRRSAFFCYQRFCFTPLIQHHPDPENSATSRSPRHPYRDFYFPRGLR